MVAFKRVLLKLSGEALAGEEGHGIDPDVVGNICEKVKEILDMGGKIWIYYDNDVPVCSVFYIPASNKSLRKHNIEYDESITGSLGPIMVRKEYVGNGLQAAMLEVIDNYAKSIGKVHMFTKAHSDNFYSIRNILKDGYMVVDEYENERGPMTAFIK